MAAYRRVDDLWSPAAWLPVHRDQLRAQRSVSSMGSLYLYLFTNADDCLERLISEMTIMCSVCQYPAGKNCVPLINKSPSHNLIIT